MTRKKKQKKTQEITEIDEIVDIEKKKKRMENETKVLNKSAEEYADKTENKRICTLMV